MVSNPTANAQRVHLKATRANRPRWRTDWGPRHMRASRKVMRNFSIANRFQGELAELRSQVGQLREDNRSLQEQLQHVREVQAASGSSSGAPDTWDAVPALLCDVEPAVTRSDMAFIEREINCLKQKISETRLKLQAAEPDTTDDEYYAATLADRRVFERQPLQRKQVSAGRYDAGPVARHTNIVGPSLFDEILPRALTPVPSSATGSAVPSAMRPRAARGQGNKKSGQKVSKENVANQYAGANVLGRPKVQRGRGLSY
ncbi:hypothetical protein VOLCADRAFT_104300 [Volvox carteri f. nagariensis]|uniref:Uncharacterized protein n=1 Tax=Volvox carteri f. nagariensis TaxID=3068 RepID=D8TSM4_VOLCA|nr:uncharacterized protein VOLCADRAFT_104300 [Volvox carteri f. nagariensis]EFJ49396.1 hypothetical protein VOLCADRAFT_104300 [Volvox carteri f. nagariensis]|eukprot:XP_002949377.1 hypothetical protein VOLCADRAFT_104300 [Volvox carteri f. nagariensis]